MSLEILKIQLQRAFDDTPERELSFKSMFGGACAYINGNVFASISNVGLALKLGAKGQKELLEAGGKMLQYEPDAPVSKSYVVVPPEIVEDRELFSQWVNQSTEYVQHNPSKKSAKRKK